MAFRTLAPSGGDAEGSGALDPLLAKRLKALVLKDVTFRDRLRRTIFKRTRTKKLYQRHMVSMEWKESPCDSQDQAIAKDVYGEVSLSVLPPAHIVRDEAKKTVHTTSLPIMKPVEEDAEASDPIPKTPPAQHRRAHSTLARISTLRVVIPEEPAIHPAFAEKNRTRAPPSAGGGVHGRLCNRVGHKRRQRRQRFLCSPQLGRRNTTIGSAGTSSSSPLHTWKPSRVAKWARRLAPHSVQTILDKKINGDHLRGVEDEKDLENLGLSRADNLPKILREIQKLQTEDVIWRFDVAKRLTANGCPPPTGEDAKLRGERGLR